MPDPPGPPGLSTRDPIRAAGSGATRRITAIPMVGPPGRRWSGGPVSVPHSNGAGASAPQDPQATLGAGGAAAGVAARAAAGVAAAGVAAAGVAAAGVAAAT